MQTSNVNNKLEVIQTKEEKSLLTIEQIQKRIEFFTAKLTEVQSLMADAVRLGIKTKAEVASIAISVDPVIAESIN